MILEEIDGNVKVTVLRGNGIAVVAVGEYISDHESSTISVIGAGKAVIRVDPSCTFDIKGIEAEGTAAPAPAPAPTPAPAPAPAPVEAAPVVEVVAPAVKTPSAPAEEAAKK